MSQIIRSLKQKQFKRKRLLNSNVPHKVLLPAWIFQQAKDNDQIKRLVLQYMIRYPNYRIIKIKGSFAVCERLEGFL
ncbi:hypothetical protein FCT18_21085 [Lysinibacillus sphaericus]|uniref:Uncharacterized protein n=1 Tax=Lysinibacillus sphaericus TaxID=1421 RepID=A0A2S0JZY2_LYSSH|nr:hypothetical protein LS41612_10665 [Lysinibacillus sphaericus]TKI16412.1 hypothetical protein FCT18_21085 [Lysinibacillus sphaericus]